MDINQFWKEHEEASSLDSKVDVVYNWMDDAKLASGHDFINQVLQTANTDTLPLCSLLSINICSNTKDDVVTNLVKNAQAISKGHYLKESTDYYPSKADFLERVKARILRDGKDPARYNLR